MSTTFYNYAWLITIMHGKLWANSMKFNHQQYLRGESTWLKPLNDYKLLWKNNSL